MGKLGVVLWVAGAIALAHIGWTWFRRHEASSGMERTVAARRSRHGSAALAYSSTSVRITQFYATAGEITDVEHDTICYGVENAKAVRLAPPVESLSPALTRCFPVEPRQDTPYQLIAEGQDGSQATASFEVHVKPAPPAILFMAVSSREIVTGDALTLCYGVSRATAVHLEPIHMAVAPVSKNCVRFYPRVSMKITLVALGAAGMKDTDHFQVKVLAASRSDAQSEPRL